MKTRSTFRCDCDPVTTTAAPPAGPTGPDAPAGPDPDADLSMAAKYRAAVAAAEAAAAAAEEAAELAEEAAAAAEALRAAQVCIIDAAGARHCGFLATAPDLAGDPADHDDDTPEDEG